MRAHHAQKMSRYAITLFLILSILLNSCDNLINEAEKQLDPVAQRQMEILKQTAQAEADDLQATMEAHVQDLHATAIAKGEELPAVLTEKTGGLIQSVKEWFGWEAPADVGAVSRAINPRTNRAVISAAFKDAFKRAGGGKSIGKTENLVHYEGGELFIQNFSGGSQNRSIIVMKEGDSKAYYITGEWLKTFEALGGFTEAGYPLSDPEKVPVWQFWHKYHGETQLYSSDQGEFALSRASGMKNVHVIPPKIWQYYTDHNEVDKIGYPLSSYPLDDQKWEKNDSLSTEATQLLTAWKAQPLRAQVFENGGALFNSNQTTIEMYEAKPRVSTGLGEGRFMNDLSGILWIEYGINGCVLKTDDCFCQTLQHSVFMSQSDSITKVLYNFGIDMIKATLSGASLVAESVYSKISFLAAEAMLEKARSGNWIDAIKSVVAGKLIESIYAAAIGEILSKPAANVTQAMIEEEFSKLIKDRYTNGLKVEPGILWVARPMDATMDRTTMDVSLIVAYDPLLNMVTGVMTSEQCARRGYGFYFKFDPGQIEGAVSGHIAPADQVWDERVHFIDLATGNRVP